MAWVLKEPAVLRLGVTSQDCREGSRRPGSPCQVGDQAGQACHSPRVEGFLTGREASSQRVGGEVPGHVLTSPRSGGCAVVVCADLTFSRGQALSKCRWRSWVWATHRVHRGSQGEGAGLPAAHDPAGSPAERAPAGPGRHCSRPHPQESTPRHRANSRLQVKQRLQVPCSWVCRQW